MDVEFLEQGINTEATKLGAEIGDADANVVMYGLKCHSLLLKDYMPFSSASGSNHAEHYINTQTIYYIYGKIPSKVRYLRNTYIHIKHNYDRVRALKWLKTYILSIDPSDYRLIIKRYENYTVFLTRLANIRLSLGFRPKMFDIIRTGELDYPYDFINYFKFGKNDNTTIMLEDLIAGMEVRRQNEERSQKIEPTKKNSKFRRWFIRK